MPLYDFRCRSCRHVFEALVRPNSAPTVCPACGAADPERLLSGFAVSSAEKTKAAAAVKRAREAKVGTADRMAMDREIEKHRRDDH